MSNFFEHFAEFHKNCCKDDNVGLYRFNCKTAKDLMKKIHPDLYRNTDIKKLALQAMQDFTSQTRWSDLCNRKKNDFESIFYTPSNDKIEAFIIGAMPHLEEEHSTLE